MIYIINNVRNVFEQDVPKLSQYGRLQGMLRKARFPSPTPFDRAIKISCADRTKVIELLSGNDLFDRYHSSIEALRLAREHGDNNFDRSSVYDLIKELNKNGFLDTEILIADSVASGHIQKP